MDGKDPLFLLKSLALEFHAPAVLGDGADHVFRRALGQLSLDLQQNLHLRIRQQSKVLRGLLGKKSNETGLVAESLKLAVLAPRVCRVAKRFFGVPEFHYYALADGICCCHAWPSGADCVAPPNHRLSRFNPVSGASPEKPGNVVFGT